MKTKIWILTAVCFILIGGIIFAGAMSMLKWDFKGLNTTKYETRTHIIEEGFKSISITTDTADIEFVKMTGDGCLVLCKELEKESHTVSVVGDTLVIERNDTQKWYDHISFFSFDTPKIRIELPGNIYSSLTINSNTGDIQIPDDFTFDSIDIKASTGDVSCKASTVNDLKIKLSTGYINAEGITAGSINFTTSTGGIKLDKCDAGELVIKTDTGNVSGSLMSSKVFICKTDTGRITVPETTKGGKCEITTDTGDIKLEVEE